MNPYDLLGLGDNPDDASVRSAYLEKIRQYPPERHPEKFEQINEAFQKLKDESSRLRYYLFNSELEIQSPLEAVTGRFCRKANRKPPDYGTLKSFLRETAYLF